MNKVTYGQAIATRGVRVWCDNCGEDLSEFVGRLTDAKDPLTITNVGGVTILTDYLQNELHRCASNG